MKKFKRIFWIVTDSLGIGGDRRESEFKDKGANTFTHIADTGLLKIPTWRAMGIGNIVNLKGIHPNRKQTAYTIRLNELSNAKDTLAGHWEMMGIKTTTPFPTFTNTGFPKELIMELEKYFDGRKIIGNKASSGTTIIDELAEQEINNNSIIIYTSADPVLQICGHEKSMGLKNLYKYAKAARKVCSSRPEWNVGRVIARPYIGDKPGSFIRTANRHDYAVKPPQRLILNDIADKGIETIAIGKINDIYVGEGIKKAIHSESNNNGMDILIDIAQKEQEEKFVMANLVEFDSHYGHRRNVEGYANAINDFDLKLTKLIKVMNKDDLLIITSDHGNDPTFPGSDHTRENVPGTIFSPGFMEPKKLDNANGFGTLGNIVATNWNTTLTPNGEDISTKLK